MSPKRVILILAPDELKELTDFLTRCAQEGRWRARKRGSAVYFSNQGVPVPEIARQVKCSTDSVYRWLRRYQEKGIRGLAHSAYHIKLTPQQVNQLLEVSHWSALKARKTIKEFRQRWSFRRMAEWVGETWHIKISPEAIRRMVQREMRELLPQLRKRR